MKLREKLSGSHVWICDGYQADGSVLFFHNSISCYNIQGTDSSFGDKQGKRKRMAGFSFSVCVVAVATLDGCVCQGGRPCSLMMAMPAHKPSPAEVCV